MTISLPHEIEQRLDEPTAALHLAIGMYVSEEASLGQAATIASLSQSRFLHELGNRRIPIHYSTDDLATDLEQLSKNPTE